MAKRRTKREKLRASSRPANHQTSNTSSVGNFTYSETSRTATSTKQFDPEDLLVVPSVFIYRDLLKTVSLSVFFIGLILALYWLIEIRQFPVPFL